MPQPLDRPRGSPGTNRPTMPPLLTPDQRYIVVRGRLWRAANPALHPDEHARLVARLMDARREVAAARRLRDDARMRAARAAVQESKVALGERGPVWWSDGTRDYNRFLARNTPYAEWYADCLARGAAVEDE